MRRTIARRAAIVMSGTLLLGAAWSLFPRSPDPAWSDMHVVRRGSFEVRVDTVGVLDAARAHQVASALRGDKAKILQLVEDGTRVVEGDLLVRFDAAPLEAEELRLAGELRSREAVVAYVTQALELEKSQAEKLLSHADVERLAALQDLARHQAYIADLEALSGRAIPVASEIEQARRKAQQVQMRLDKSGGDLERVKRETVHRLAQAMAEINKAQSELQSTREALRLVHDEMRKLELRAPATGFVVMHEVFSGEQKRRMRVGDIAYQGFPILYVPDLSAMIVRTKVREEDLQKIVVGKEAAVAVDAYPETLFRGRVSGIGALALEGAAAAGKFFQMTVALEGHDDRLRPGMTARVAIVADRALDALVVPLPAVFEDGHGPVCLVLEGRSVAARPVTIGRRGDHLAEIVDGLAEGERVSLARP